MSSTVVMVILSDACLLIIRDRFLASQPPCVGSRRRFSVAIEHRWILAYSALIPGRSHLDRHGLTAGRHPVPEWRLRNYIFESFD